MKINIESILQAVDLFIKALLGKYINYFKLKNNDNCFSLTIKRIVVVCKTLRIYDICFSEKPRRIRSEFLTLLLYMLKRCGYELVINERGYYVFCKVK